MAKDYLNIIERDMKHSKLRGPLVKLLVWAKKIILDHYIYNIILGGMLSKDASAQLWKLNGHGNLYKILVSKFLGIEYGYRLHNLREFVRLNI